MFLPRLNEISGGCEKIVPVSESFRSNLKFFKNDRFNCVVVRVNGPPSSIINHTSRTPYLFHSFSDFVVYVVTTLIFRKNQRQSASFQAGHHRTQQIDRQSALQTAEKDNTDQIPFNKRQLNLT